MRNKNSYIKVVVPLMAILAAMLMGGILIVFIHGNPLTAFSYLLMGAFGNPSKLSECLIKSSPLIFTGLSATFAYKCGVFNLGAQGQFVMGALISLVVSQQLSSAPAAVVLISSILFGALAGGIWGAIPGLLKIYRGLNEMIVSIMLNYIAILFMGYLYSGPLREGSVPQTSAVLVKLPSIVDGSRVHLGIIVAVLLGIGIYYFMFFTAWGFRLRAVGMNQTASEFNGFPVKKLMLISFITSGAIAGLGGALELFGTQFRLMAGFGANYGFDGVAIALIGQLNPIGTMFVAFLFAVLRTGATTMQVGTGMPTSVIDIVQALIIVFAVAGTSWTNLTWVRQRIVNGTKNKSVKGE